MGRKHAKIISRDAFMQSFVEAEVIMRRNLATRIQVLIDQNKSGLSMYDNEDPYDSATSVAHLEGIIAGLELAQQEVFGKVETNDVG